jgi:hypothetical protein
LLPAQQADFFSQQEVFDGCDLMVAPDERAAGQE